MNERILQYAEQARLYAKSVFPHLINDPIGWNYEYHKKFAELIVWECSAYVEGTGNWLVAMEMKEHFGVEDGRT